MALPVPVARQREVVCLPSNGHQIVLGTAGSGKTTMAILRANFLSDKELPNGGRTLLLTYNKALTSYIRFIAGSHLSDVEVNNYHNFARGYLNYRGKMGWNSIAGPAQKAGFIREAVLQVRTEFKPHSFFDRPVGFFESEISWLERHGIVSLEDYISQKRIGRAEARLERRLREAMWRIHTVYLEKRTLGGFRYDWDDVATSVGNEFTIDTSERRYRHIVIDEGQDLSPEMLRSLSVAVPKEGSITFFGDVAQQIYGHRMSWRSAGLTPKQVWRFSENYRNTSEIAALGLAIAEMPYYNGVPDMVRPTAWRAAGPKPTLVKLADTPSELVCPLKSGPP